MIIPRRFSGNGQKKQQNYESYRKRSEVSKELEEHISWAIAENGSNPIESPESTAGSKNVEQLTKAYANLEKAEAERLKVELQICESKRRQWVNWDVVIPKVAGIMATALVTGFWICIEQGTPVPSRLVQMSTSLTTPRGL